MYNCPHCQQATITAWGKMNASDIFPVRCSACAGFSYISAWAMGVMVLAVDVFFWGTIILALWLKSWLVLLAYPLSLWLVSLALGLVFNLKPIDGETLKKRRAKRRWEFWLLVVVILIACAWGVWQDF